jgi:hypothetical protein
MVLVYLYSLLTVCCCLFCFCSTYFASIVVVKRLTHVVVVLLLSILLQSPQILLRQRLLLNGQAVQTPGGLGAQLIEEVQEGGGVHLAGGHADVGVHDLEVGYSPVLVQPGVVTQQFVQKGVACAHLQHEATRSIRTLKFNFMFSHTVQNK